MGNLNKAMLIGRLGQDPDKRLTNSGTSVVNVGLATNDYYNDSSGQRQERTEWHRIVFWGRLADIVSQYARKGSQIYVEGMLRTREWEDKEKQKKYTTEIVASVCQLLDPPSQSDRPQSYASPGPGNPAPSYRSAQTPQTGQAPNQPPSPPPGNDFIEDDIPF